MVSKKKFLGIVLGTSCLAVILITVVVVVLVFEEGPDTVKVRTVTGGTLIGKVTTLKDGKTKMNEFHNIRYAQAPVGTLRFRPPVRYEVAGADTEISATNSTPIMCLQSDTGLGTEDCLVLSVRSSNLDESALKPVLMWIHGGGLIAGYGAAPGYSFDSEVTHELDAVTVNINYRLGFLGFSSVKELWNYDAGGAFVDANANNGIRDMIAALDWIQDNIAKFGGDPDRVTIIGESGGGTAVLALICSPLANNKFHAAISQSPAPEMRFSYTEGDTFQRESENSVGFGCNQDTLAERKQCLYDKPAKDLIFDFKNPANVPGTAYFLFPMSYGMKGEYAGQIIVDGTVVTKAPRELGAAGFQPASPLPIIISNCAEEAWQQSWISKPPVRSKGDLAELLTTHLKKINKDFTEEEVSNLTNLYTQNSPIINPYQDPGKVWSYLVSDIRSTCPTNDVVKDMSGTENTNRKFYRLYVSHKPSIEEIPAFHAYDALALFGYSSSNLNSTSAGLNEKDFAFHDHYVAMVKKFAIDQTLEEGWESFPGKSMTYENSVSISSLSSNEPQQYACKVLEGLDLVKYGWQN
ncbi:hypothetical protein ACHWQZ_G001336 [Mnemiopsis leidyi]